MVEGRRSGRNGPSASQDGYNGREAQFQRSLEAVAKYIRTMHSGVKVEQQEVDEKDVGRALRINVNMSSASMPTELKELAANVINAFGMMTLGRELIPDPKLIGIGQREDGMNAWNYDPETRRVYYPSPNVYDMKVDLDAGRVKANGPPDEETVQMFCTALLFKAVVHELMHAGMAESGMMPVTKDKLQRLPMTFVEAAPAFFASIIDEMVRKKAGLEWMSTNNRTDTHYTVMSEIEGLKPSPSVKLGELKALAHVDPDLSVQYLMGRLIPSISEKYTGYTEYQYHNGDFLCSAIYLSTGRNLAESAKVILGSKSLQDLAHAAVQGLVTLFDGTRPLRSDGTTHVPEGRFDDAIFSDYARAATTKVKTLKDAEDSIIVPEDEPTQPPYVLAMHTMIESVNMLGSSTAKDKLLSAFDEALQHTYREGGVWLGAIYYLRDMNGLPQPRKINFGN